METGSRLQTNPLIRKLRKDPSGFDFFQAVRLIEQLNDDKPRIGKSVKPADDPVRFGQKATLSFEPSSIASYMSGTRTTHPAMMVYFFGLLGPNGPLPAHMTEFIRDRERNNADTAQSRFLDMFHHRLISLFFQAWATNDQSASFDRPDDDWFSEAANSFAGLDGETFYSRDTIPDISKRFWSGRLMAANGCSEGLESLLTGYFEIPVKVKPFSGQWMRIPEQYLCRLNGDDETTCLGMNVIVGECTYDRAQKFSIKLGALSFEDFERMLPGRRSFRRLMDWVKYYITTPMTWDVEYELKGSDVPQTQLGRYGQLGLSTWLKSGEFTKNAEDLVVHSESHVAQLNGQPAYT